MDRQVYLFSQNRQSSMMNTQYIFHRYFIQKVNEGERGKGKSGINVVADFKQQDEEDKEEDKAF